LNTLHGTMNKAIMALSWARIWRRNVVLSDISTVLYDISTDISTVLYDISTDISTVLYDISTDIGSIIWYVHWYR
jgi:hypothetical protein